MRRELGLVLLVALAACGGAAAAMPGSIGVVARREAGSGRVIIVEVPDGGAGARAGLEVGDEVLAIDGVAVATMSKDEFQRAVRGPAGSSVEVDVRRDGLRRRIRVQRLAMRALEK
ncbi:MAG: PDZ domain-containing protein [Deltaproteobacteria bacterium]|nr:PDZ domain-containing protein [Deltaproteobacteria bacterium]